MKFWEAMKALNEGKKVRNTDWAHESHIFIFKEPKLVDENYEDYKMEIDASEIADDEYNVWEIYEEPKETE